MTPINSCHLRHRNVSLRQTIVTYGTAMCHSDNTTVTYGTAICHSDNTTVTYGIALCHSDKQLTLVAQHCVTLTDNCHLWHSIVSL